MPSGRILVSGQEQRDSWYLNNPGASNSFSWTDAPNLQNHRTWGTAVQMPTSGQPGVTDKIWQIGGGYSSAPNTSTEIFDESDEQLDRRALAKHRAQPPQHGDPARRRDGHRRRRLRRS